MRRHPEGDDPLASFVSLFSEEDGYLDFAAFGPVGSHIVEEERALVTLVAAARHGTLGGLMEQDERVREAVADVTGFRPDQVVFQPSTSMGLMQAVFGLSGALLLSESDYPSLPYAAVRAADARGVLAPTWLDLASDSLESLGYVTPGTLRERLTPAVSAVAVSLVDFRTGFLADLEGIRHVIGDRLLIVDAVQGVGAVDAPLEVADVVASGGQKWLRAGWGTGFLALSDRALEQLTPVLSGFVVGMQDWSHRVEAPPADASAFQVTRADPVAQARFAAALEAYAEVGAEAVADRVLERSERLIALADEYGLDVVSPRSETDRAGIVVVAPVNLTALEASLHNYGITATVRGGHVRFSAHVSTTDETLESLGAAFKEYAAAVRA